MRRGRLRLTIYLGLIVFVFVIGGLFLAFQVVKAMPSAEVRVAARHIAANLAHHRADPARLQAELDELSQTKLQVTLYDAERRVLGSTVTPPLPVGYIDHPSTRPDLTFVDEVREDGRLVATAILQARPRGSGPC